jgi:hypothetical protein
LDSPFDFMRLIAGHFSYSVFTWQHGFDASLIERERPDVVIQELTERWLLGGPQGQAPRE